MSKINRTFVLALLILITSSGFGQIAFVTTWKGQELKGQVKSIKATTYFANEKFDEVIKGDLLSWKLWRFDAKGESTEYTKFGDFYEETVKFENKYDSQNRLTEKDCFNSNGDLAWKRVNKYDNEKITQTIYYNEDGILSEKYLYKYDDNTKKCETWQYDGNGDLIYKWVHDKNGNLLEEYDYFSTGDVSKKTEYEYDNSGTLNRTLIYELLYSLYGSEKFEEEYLYNDKADIIVLKSYDYSYDDDYNPVTTQKIEYTYKYKYDNKGNWIEKILFKSEAEIAIAIEEREIEYYK